MNFVSSFAYLESRFRNIETTIVSYFCIYESNFVAYLLCEPKWTSYQSMTSKTTKSNPWRLHNSTFWTQLVFQTSKGLWQRCYFSAWAIYLCCHCLRFWKLKKGITEKTIFVLLTTLFKSSPLSTGSCDIQLPVLKCARVQNSDVKICMCKCDLCTTPCVICIIYLLEHTILLASYIFKIVVIFCHSACLLKCASVQKLN